MNEAELFGKLLRATRKAHELSLGQLAEKCGTDAKHLGRIERGEKHPSFKLIIELAKAMNVLPSVFFEFDNARADPRAVRRQLQQLLSATDVEQLQRAAKVLRAVLQP